MQKFRQYFFIILLFIATVLLGYNYYYRPFEKNFEQVVMPLVQEQELSEEIKNSPNYILLQLSATEKIAQMIAAPVLVTDVNKELETQPKQASQEAQVSIEVETERVTKFGFYTLFGTDISLSQARETTDNLKENKVLSLRPYIAVDHEGGEVQRLSGTDFTQLDSWQKLCSLETVDRQSILKRSANELGRAGIDIVLGPVLDVGNNSILKSRICSKDSYAIVADRSMEYVTIFSKAGILPVLKHFPGIGLTKKDLHKAYDFVSVLENDIKLYKYVLDQNTRIGVMSAHVGVTSQDKDIPCSVSPYCVSELNAAYPNVLVFTDALEMAAALYDVQNPTIPKSLVQVSKEAILAGNTVLLYGQSVSTDELTKVISELAREYESSVQMKAAVDASVLKIINYKL